MNFAYDFAQAIAKSTDSFKSLQFADVSSTIQLGMIFMSLNNAWTAVLLADGDKVTQAAASGKKAGQVAADMQQDSIIYQQDTQDQGTQSGIFQGVVQGSNTQATQDSTNEAGMLSFYSNIDNFLSAALGMMNVKFK